MTCLSIWKSMNMDYSPWEAPHVGVEGINGRGSTALLPAWFSRHANIQVVGSCRRAYHPPAK